MKPPPPLLPCAAASLAGICSGQLDEENPSTPISSGLLVQADEGVSLPVVDLIDQTLVSVVKYLLFRCLMILRTEAVGFERNLYDLIFTIDSFQLEYMIVFESVRRLRLKSLSVKAVLSFLKKMTILMLI
ncbi:hypothetical protein F511_02652 [Dorcoceras hygrometricum]|uniref:Uncharacterized protein n=1 Tax=Dorcoceras hygrometricum TaxID=472368 RepID=A0A2Z7DB60_9LAMI|nr:hypothetical protein F511_02652 [Dorcoceras hygrometricum]